MNTIPPPHKSFKSPPWFKSVTNFIPFALIHHHHFFWFLHRIFEFIVHPHLQPLGNFTKGSTDVEALLLDSISGPNYSIQDLKK